MLGYNIFDPTEVVPEFTADFGLKRNAKVDYAIVQHGQPIILVEAKKHGAPLQVKQESQLQSAFSQYVRGLIDARLKSALERGNEQTSMPAKDQSFTQTLTTREDLTIPLDLFIKTSSGLRAKGRYDGQSVVVLAESQISQAVSNTYPDSLLGLRKTMIEDGRLVDGGLVSGAPVYRLTQDHGFGASSTAASFVMGYRR